MGAPWPPAAPFEEIRWKEFPGRGIPKRSSMHPTVIRKDFQSDGLLSTCLGGAISRVHPDYFPTKMIHR